MAGGHLGGGGHFGGHHGGGFGGGFRGGSGGFRGGGFGGDSGRDELGYAEWDSGNYPQGSFAYFAVEIGSLLIMFIISCIVHFYHVPGFNLLNSVMFIVATILFIIAFSAAEKRNRLRSAVLCALSEQQKHQRNTAGKDLFPMRPLLLIFSFSTPA